MFPPSIAANLSLKVVVCGLGYGETTYSELIFYRSTTDFVCRELVCGVWVRPEIEGVVTVLYARIYLGPGVQLVDHAV